MTMTLYECPSIRLVPTSCTIPSFPALSTSYQCPSIRLVPTSCTKDQAGARS